MKRPLLLLLLFILIGAAINLPIAMQFLHSRTSPRAPTLIDKRGPEAVGYEWPADTPHDIPWPKPSSWMMAGSFGYRHYDVRGWNGTMNDPTDLVIMEVHRMGWPLPVLEQVQMWWPWDDPKWKTTNESDPALYLVWSGVVLNPLIFGLTLWLVFVIPIVLFFNIRLRHRIEQKVCIKCAYPRGTSEKCSECGYKFITPLIKTDINNS